MIDGALLLDKPVGLSSNAVLQQTKRIFEAKKAGHAGTLDPLASGLLVVLFGEATKFAGPLLDDEKEYLATLKLGERTSTGDAEGDVLEKKEITFEGTQILSVLERFRGEIEQVPPMHSALKRGGVPLYRLARRGQQVERPARRVRIHEIALLSLEKPYLQLRVRCSKGTYVRSLAEDLGAALGCGAHLSALRRTASGRFRLADAVTLESLSLLSATERQGRLLALSQLLAGLPRTELDADAEARFRSGQALKTSIGEGLCGVYGADGNVIGLGRADLAGALRPLRLTSQGADKHRKPCD
jgi:tRNA pseudouridine55 synthase